MKSAGTFVSLIDADGGGVSVRALTTTNWNLIETNERKKDPENILL